MLARNEPGATSNGRDTIGCYGEPSASGGPVRRRLPRSGPESCRSGGTDSALRAGAPGARTIVW